MYRIMLVEDDATIAAAVAETLAGWGYEVRAAEDFSGVMEEFRAFQPQLVLMDLNLPVRSGYHWCAQIRKESTVPVIFITSSADNMILVTAIHQGADDFVAKPFDANVLVAKVQAMLRRSYDFAADTDTVVHRGLVLSRAEGNARVGNRRVDLTRNEYLLLDTLLQSKGRIVTREALMRRLWEDESFVDDNTLTVNVTRLRKKLADAGLDDYIETKKGMGYLVPAGDG